ncbi:MAG: DUF2800 domain-containing protein, partial [Gammaproteobacteria bacterium]|nr:DUF2800 domain-containing protein [Gammaproteobacteria bacterium]
GSVKLTDKLHPLPDSHTIHTARGTVIHAMGEALLLDPTEGFVVGAQWGKWEEVGEFNDHKVDIDMINMAMEYADAVEEMQRRMMKKRSTMMVEERDMWDDDLYGTPDCVLVDYDRVVVIDLKTGSHLVSPVENYQLMIYAGMVLKTLGLLDVWKKVRLVIVQPPDERDPVKMWDTNTVEIAAFMEKVEEAMVSDHLAAGEWCKYCPVAASCTIKHELAVNAASLSLDGLSPEGWAKALHYAELLDPWITSVWKRSTQLAATAGLTVPGYKLVNKTGRLTWKDKEEAEKVLMEFMGDAPAKVYNELSLRTPTQLKKELKEFVDGSVIDELSERPDRGYALVQESDKREAVESPANLLAAAKQLELFNT